MVEMRHDVCAQWRAMVGATHVILLGHVMLDMCLLLAKVCQMPFHPAASPRPCGLCHRNHGRVGLTSTVDNVVAVL